MRAVVQRVSEASVSVDDETVGQVANGLLVLLGVGEGDTEADARYIARKVAGLRIFGDEQGLMNLSVHDVGGSVLMISQFTLYGDCRKGRRPSFTQAADPDEANRLYELTVDLLREGGLDVATGVFQAMMDVSLVNRGPVTVLLDSGKAF